MYEVRGQIEVGTGGLSVLGQMRVRRRLRFCGERNLLGGPLRSILDLISAARCPFGFILEVSRTLLAPSQTVLELL